MEVLNTTPEWEEQEESSGMKMESGGGGFSIKIGICPEPEAELCTILHGLKETWQQGLRKIMLETDSLLVRDSLD